MGWRFRIGLWVVLIVLFVAFYQFFSRAPGADDRGERAVASVLLPLLVFGVAGGFGVFSFLRARKGIRLNNEAIALIAEGRFQQAVAKLEEAAPIRRTALVPHNLGVAKLNLWRVSEASDLFEQAWKKTALVNLRHLSGPFLALTHALQGDAEGARQWLEKVKAIKHDRAPTAVLARVVLACRANEWTQAVELLRSHELQSLGGPLRGLADTLRSWASERTGGPRREIDRVALFGEASPDGLKQVWPEVIAFVGEGEGRAQSA